MFSLSDIFSTKPAATPSPAVPGVPGDPTGTAPVIPVPGTPAPAPAPADPLDNLWDTSDIKAPPAGLDYNIDPAQLAALAGKIDYSTVITPEIRQKLAAGGEDAVAATIEALNAVQRVGFQQNAAATTKLIQAAVANSEERFDARIESKLKLLGLNEQLAETHPALSNPRYAPVVNGIKEQIIAKFPDATTAEINKYTVRYLNKMAEELNPGLVSRANTNANAGLGNLAALNKEQDWAQWLSN